MADIELVIKIPEEAYKASHNIHTSQMKFIQMPLKIIANGIPLPKGHGRLVILSEDSIKRERVPMDCSCQLWISDVGLSNATVAIIEADEGGLK